MASTPLRNPLADSPPLSRAFALPTSAEGGPSSSSTSSTSSTSSASPALSLGLPRGHRGRSVGQDTKRDRALADDAIRGTDSDALLSRLSALRLGYLPPDPYSEDLVSNAAPQRDPSSFPQHTTASSLPIDRHSLGGPSWRAPTQAETLQFSAPRYGQPLSASSGRTGSGFAYGYSKPCEAIRGPANPLASFAGAGPGARRPPLINIGTYLRCRSIDQLAEKFLLQGQDDDGDDENGKYKGKGKGRQIISLGAGSDSRYWRTMASPELKRHLKHYLELDFPQVTAKKVSSIRRSPRLQSHLEGLDADAETEEAYPTSSAPTSLSSSDSLRSKCYSICPFDLRDFEEEQASGAGGIAADLLLSDLDPSVPTLLLFECVLAYIEPESADAMLAYFGRRFDRLAAVGYDMCLAGDAEEATASAQVSRFGKVLLQNLESRNLSLPGAKAALTIQAQADRYTHLWAEGTVGATMSHGKSLYCVWEELEAQEKERISRLEGLDEVEELDILLRHYCITWAARGVEL